MTLYLNIDIEINLNYENIYYIHTLALLNKWINSGYDTYS